MAWGDLLFWSVSGSLDLMKGVIALLLLAFSVWMIVDAAQRKFRVEAERWIWIVLIAFTVGIGIGALLYYIFVRALNPGGVAKDETRKKRR
jgi:hypothetical protein